MSYSAVHSNWRANAAEQAQRWSDSFGGWATCYVSACRFHPDGTRFVPPASDRVVLVNEWNTTKWQELQGLLQRDADFFKWAKAHVFDPIAAIDIRADNAPALVGEVGRRLEVLRDLLMENAPASRLVWLVVPSAAPPLAERRQLTMAELRQRHPALFTEGSKALEVLIRLHALPDLAQSESALAGSKTAGSRRHTKEALVKMEALRLAKRAGKKWILGDATRT